MLKSDIHDTVWFFDLEWVPDAAGAIRLFDLPPDTPELEAMQRLWQETKDYDETENPRPFVKYLFSRVVSIAFLSRRVIHREGERHIEFAINSLPKLPSNETTVDEAEIIGKFLHYIGHRNPQLVGFNSAESDLQVLIQRGMVNEIRAESFSMRPPKPWEGRDYFDARNSEAHLDLLQRFSRGAMSPKLNDMARLCGFPGKIDATGDQVVDMWLAGDITKIVEYNQIDTLNTYLIWLRMVNFAGKLTEEEYFTEQEDFRTFLETEAAKEDNDHIRRFLAKWDDA
ncbi:ribonuclease H-like domain-containing protein [Leptolyngbya sp. 7M]|uniref:ribonuclease H-like domain-containing protein n=1 Tax=Leptolyngbya sp. 7M TaxID=2812896 RepID=UPI001B8CAA9F|nr:ribonuclease H-like domain-containing protein [Leptolyngbya sp. 7M]QYO66196.1 ribonuclease H-like domain-containing protein [Leptolyngbya sp. 7M]